MFIEKTLEEFDSMTSEEQTSYAFEKSKFEKEERTKLKDSVEELKSNIERLDKKEDVEKIKKIEDEIAKINLSIESLGNSRQNTNENMTENYVVKIAKVVQNIVDNGTTNKAYRISSGESKAHPSTVSYDAVKNVIIKDDASNTHTMGIVSSSVYPNGSSANASDQFLNRRAQYMGFFSPVISNSDFIDFMNVETLVEGNLYADYFENTSGDAEFVPECGIKPLTLIDVKGEIKKAGKVAIGIRLNEEYQRFVYKWVENKVVPYLQKQLMNQMHTSILNGNVTYGFDGLLTNASVFVADPSLAQFTAPNELDAIGAVLTQRYNLGYASDLILISPQDRFIIDHTKATDGHYSINNNNSIVKLNGETYYNGVTNSLIKVSKDIQAGNLVVMDFSQIAVAIDPELIIRAGYDKDGDLSRNIYTIFFEKFFAVYKPSVNSGAVFYDTFDNIKSLITI